MSKDSIRRFVFLLLLALAAAPAVLAASDAPTVLARIDLEGPLEDLGIPVHAHLRGAEGEYVLSRATTAVLDAAGVRYTVLDTNADGAGYFIGLERRTGARREAARRIGTVLDDGRRVIVRIDSVPLGGSKGGRDSVSLGGSKGAEALRHLGFQVSLLPQEPMKLQAAPPVAFAQAGTPNEDVAAMIAEARKAYVHLFNGQLSGAEPIRVGGMEFSLDTRATASGPPIDVATQFVYEHMVTQGLTVRYHPWDLSGLSGRNVVGELVGTTKPEEIVLMGAHLDSRPFSGPAPGADDNGSGSTALMLASKIFAQRSFERTIRLVFFTGEEQGLLGSQVYARERAEAGERIVAVLNFDMIAWESNDDPILRLHTRLESNPGYEGDLALAEAFIDVVDTYALLSPIEPVVTPDGITASDHSPFWNSGFSAMLAIEDDQDDFNPNWHRPTDRRDTLDLNYFTTVVQAAIGTVANLAVVTGAAMETVPERPTGLQGFALAMTRARLLWTDRSNNESAFEVQVREGNRRWRKAARAPSNQATVDVSDLKAGRKVSFRVRAIRGTMASAWSNVLNLDLPDLVHPQGLVATALSPTSVRLQWNDRSNNERNFEIQVRTPETPWAPVANAGRNAQRATISDLTPGERYHFRIRARKGRALSAWSNRATVELSSPQ